MKILGEIAFNFSNRGLVIVLNDMANSLNFAEIYVEPEKVCELISGKEKLRCEIDLSRTPCTKKRTKIKKLEFPVPNDEKLNKRELAKIICQHYLRKNYTADLEFNSHDSFFIKDGITWARTVIKKL